MRHETLGDHHFKLHDEQSESQWICVPCKSEDWHKDKWCLYGHNRWQAVEEKVGIQLIMTEPGKFSSSECNCAIFSLGWWSSNNFFDS